MSEWKEYKLGEIANIQTGPFGSQLHQSDYVDVGIPSIMPVNIGDRMNISTEKIVYITEEDATRLTRYRVQEGDIVYSRRGDVEKCAYIGKAENGWLCGTGCLRISIDSSKADSKFIAYYLSTEDMKSWISNNAVGTTMPNLNSSILQQVPLSLPSLDEQKRIASILSSLDDKIDLLNRENATLEAMAETLFRQWFIEEAKEDWEEGKLGSLIEIKYGKDHKKLNDGTIPVLGSGGIMRYAESALYDNESVLIPRKGSLNNVMYIDEPFWTVDTMFYTEMRRPNIAKFIYHFMKGQDLANMNVGSAVPSMTTEVLNNIPLDIPPQELFDKFEETVSVLYLKQKQNCFQIYNLSKQQDVLLPKLMSNEINI
jgi:type I restriction enzyme S subunit